MRPFKTSFLFGLIQAVNLVTIGKPKASPTIQYKNEIGELRKKAATSDETSKYFVEVYLTDARAHQGPGHISASLIKATKNKPEIVTHTSYMPGVLGIINGVFLGFVPVLARNFPGIRDDDVLKAEKIIRIPLSETAFNAGVAKQQELELNNDMGVNLYAITGRFNPMASFITAVYSCYRGAEIKIKAHQKEHGMYPAEDHTGTLIIEDALHPESYTHSELLNCASAVQSVLTSVGLEFTENHFIPSELTQEISNQPGAEVVAESLISVEHPELLTQETELDDIIPEP